MKSKKSATVELFLIPLYSIFCKLLSSDIANGIELGSTFPRLSDEENSSQRPLFYDIYMKQNVLFLMKTLFCIIILFYYILFLIKNVYSFVFFLFYFLHDESFRWILSYNFFIFLYLFYIYIYITPRLKQYK